MKTEISVSDNGVIEEVRYCSYTVNAEITNKESKTINITVGIIYSEDIYGDNTDERRILQEYQLNGERYYQQEYLEEDIWEEISKIYPVEERDDPLLRDEIHKQVDKIGEKVREVIEKNQIEMGSCE